LPEVKGRWEIGPMAGTRGAIVQMDTCIHSKGGWKCARERHIQLWLSWPVLHKLISAAGFRVLGRHALPDYAPARPEDPWIQIVAQRQ
jgi:hypothetical protein